MLYLDFMLLRYIYENLPDSADSADSADLMFRNHYQICCSVYTPPMESIKNKK